MKSLHFFSLFLGVLIGLVISGLSPSLHVTAKAQSTTEALTQDDLDKRLDDLITVQNDIKKRLENITTETQFLKAASGK